MAVGFGVDEHPFATFFDVHQGYRVLTHSHVWSFLVVVFCERNRLKVGLVFKGNQRDDTRQNVLGLLSWKIPGLGLTSTSQL